MAGHCCRWGPSVACEAIIMYTLLGIAQCTIQSKCCEYGPPPLLAEGLVTEQHLGILRDVPKGPFDVPEFDSRIPHAIRHRFHRPASRHSTIPLTSVGQHHAPHTTANTVPRRSLDIYKKTTQQNWSPGHILLHTSTELVTRKKSNPP